jgi:aspartate/methionine/tyrosine aminotransferase
VNLHSAPKSLTFKMLPKEIDLCLRLIQDKGMFLVPSYCFEMEGFLRIGYGCKTEILKEGLSRFKAFLNTYAI